MITEKDLQEAIAECEGIRNPNANTCMKLAAFYTIRNEMFGTPVAFPNYYSSAPAPARESAIEYSSNTEFGQIISSQEPSRVFGILDELMSTLQIINPRLYQSFLRKLTE